MDEAVKRHRALERVRCPLGSYTDAFFRALPPSVRILELYVDVDIDVGVPFAHEGALADLLWDVRDSRAHRHGHGRGDLEGHWREEERERERESARTMALEEVRFLSQYRTTLPLSARSGVVEAARAGGVRLVCVRAGLYTPVGCMAEADIVQSSECENRCDPLGYVGLELTGVGGFSQVSAPTFVIKIDLTSIWEGGSFDPLCGRLPGSARGWRSYLLATPVLYCSIYSECNRERCNLRLERSHRGTRTRKSSLDLVPLENKRLDQSGP